MNVGRHDLSKNSYSEKSFFENDLVKKNITLKILFQTNSEFFFLRLNSLQAYIKKSIF